MNANYKPVNVTASLLATGLVLTLGTDTVTAASCAPDNGGLTLPAGMCAPVFADNLGQAPQRRDGLADDTVHSEPVSSIISQVSGKNTGIFRYYGANAGSPGVAPMPQGSMS